MKTLLCAVALLSLAGCARTDTPVPVVDAHDADLKAIHDLEAAVTKAWAAKDLDGIMAQYAPDAMLVVTNTPVAKGTAELRGMLAELLKDPGLKMTLETGTTDVSGNLGIQQGGYTIEVTDPKTKKPITEHGSSLLVFKKQDNGTWRIAEDFNSAGPVETPASK